MKNNWMIDFFSRSKTEVEIKIQDSGYYHLECTVWNELLFDEYDLYMKRSPFTLFEDYQNWKCEECLLTSNMASAAVF